MPAKAKNGLQSKPQPRLNVEAESAVSVRVYAVVYALKGVSYIVGAESLTAEDPRVTRVKDDPGNFPSRELSKKKRKGDFLREIHPGDVVYLDNGGPADRFVFSVMAHGGIVRRISGFKLPPSRVQEVLQTAGWSPGTERAHGKESGETLTARKARAMALWVTAKTEPELFEETNERDLSLLRLKLAYRSYHRMKRGMIRAVQGLLAGYNDLALLEFALIRQRTARQEGEAIHSFAIEKIAYDLLGGETPVEVIRDFTAQVGIEFPGGFPVAPRKEDVERLVDILLNTDKFHSTNLMRLKAARKRIVQLLTGGKMEIGGEKTTVPANFIYEQVFSKIPGMGPGTISAQIMSSIGDIRRFRSRAALTAYAGYHHFADGSRARPMVGKPSNWEKILKQGIWLWCQGTIKLPTVKSGNSKIPNIWREKLDSRKAFELYKILREQEKESTARNLGYKFLPMAFAKMPVAKSVLAFLPIHYLMLAEHVDALRKQAGVQGSGEEEDEEDDDPTVSKIKDPVLAKLVAGVKGRAHNKALRWLGQQIIRHIYKEWNRAIGEIVE